MTWQWECVCDPASVDRVGCDPDGKDRCLGSRVWTAGHAFFPAFLLISDGQCTHLSD